MPLSESDTSSQAHQASNNNEPVWTFRGYEIRPGEFNAAMVHYYRAEIQRSNVWRQRLDNTTNWAVITAGAAISFVLSQPEHHYAAIILNTLLVTIFLWIEARRYRYYELWAYRSRLMEQDFFATMLVPPFAPNAEWAENLAKTLQYPEFSISMLEAFGRRFRRNYMWIFLVLGLAWILKNFIHPEPTTSMKEFVERLTIGPIPGWMMLVAGILYNGLIFTVGFATIGMQKASGEVLHKTNKIPILDTLGRILESIVAPSADGAPPPKRRSRMKPRDRLLCLIICERHQKVAERIMKELKRGVTSLHGTGMHSQQEREVLMIATTVWEIKGIKAMVQKEDPKAFFIVMPAHEVLGYGFEPLEV